MSTPEFRSGFVALAGRPNVGKSTLLNALVGQKVSIVTPKPQTTRHRILGIDTRSRHQIVFIDMPGLHRGPGRALNRAMNRAAGAAIAEADAIVLVLEALRWTQEDQDVLDRARTAGRPLIAAVNKVDRIRPRSRLLPFLRSLAEKASFADIVPISALKGTNVDTLRSAVLRHLPEGPAYFPEDQISDRSERFQIAELIREKFMMRLREEIPYGLTVEVEAVAQEGDLLRVAATVWVERESHKGIVIGQRATQLKACGSAARRELERRFDRRVHLDLRVKVKENWADRERELRDLGLGDE
jgi:GTP-binding protein Era